jgi:hypothetical protein
VRATVGASGDAEPLLALPAVAIPATIEATHASALPAAGPDASTPSQSQAARALSRIPTDQPAERRERSGLVLRRAVAWWLRAAATQRERTVHHRPVSRSHSGIGPGGGRLSVLVAAVIL